MKAEHEKAMATLRENSNKLRAAANALANGVDGQGPIEHEILSSIESRLGKKVRPIEGVTLVDAGGFIPADVLPQATGNEMDMDMGDGDGDGTTAAFPMPHALNTGGSHQTTMPHTVAPDQGTGSGEWVMVPPGGGATADVGSSSSSNHSAAPAPHLQPPPHSEIPRPMSVPQQQQQQQPLISSTGTPALSLGFDTPNDFGDLNTAGEALDNLDHNTDMDMDLNSFGDAFSAGRTGDGHGSDM